MATSPGPARPATPPTAQHPTQPKALYSQLDARLLRQAGTSTVLLRNGERWEKVKLLELDTWSLLVQTGQGGVLLPKHSIDAYLLDPA